MDSKEFGKKVREIRERKNLTQEELSNLTGFSKPYISIIENGKQGIPQPKTLKKLANGLGVRYFKMMYLAGIISEEEYNLYKNQKMVVMTDPDSETYKYKDYNLDAILADTDTDTMTKTVKVDGKVLTQPQRDNILTYARFLNSLNEEE